MIEFIFTIAILTLFSLAGRAALLPFRQNIPYLAFATPITGLLLTVLLTSALYSVAGFSFTYATYTALLSLSLLSFISFIYVKPQLTHIKWLIPVVLLVLLMTYLTNYTTLTLGQQGFLFMDGTDHLGYAHPADWILNHFANQTPVLSADKPYDSWPYFMFHDDPRAGSYFTLALIAKLRGLSSMFAYDPSCAIILSAGILGVAGIYARSSLTFFLLLVGLSFSHWFDYSRSGYLAKILAYPSALVCLGLFLQAPRPFLTKTLVPLFFLVAATTIMHSFLSTALVLIVIGGLFLLISCLRKKNITDDTLTLLLLVSTAIVITGVLARPQNLSGIGNINTHWSALLPQLLDLEFLIDGPHLSHLGRARLLFAFEFMTLSAIFYLIVAIKNKIDFAITFISAAIILLLFFILKKSYWPAYQMTGVFYPWFLCSAAILLDQTKAKTKLFYAILITLIISILLHLPRFIGAIHHYAGKNITHSLQFLQNDFLKLTETIGNQSVQIDVPDHQYAIPLLVELGRKNIHWQWTSKSWKEVLGYRDWPAPTYKTRATWLIRLKPAANNKRCKLVVDTRQYQLLSC
ncbi:hypothetical protein AYO45_05785 [Gammaproteobacteria bacterium SCGC AG-212-F23]|nr:hypothetical protein AYO45_05785 [Gammaproteobacteria bacterium SCGC AG-212-F23]